MFYIWCVRVWVSGREKMCKDIFIKFVIIQLKWVFSVFSAFFIQHKTTHFAYTHYTTLCVCVFIQNTHILVFSGVTHQLYDNVEFFLSHSTNSNGKIIRKRRKREKRRRGRRWKELEHSCKAQCARRKAERVCVW